MEGGASKPFSLDDDSKRAMVGEGAEFNRRSKFPRDPIFNLKNNGQLLTNINLKYKTSNV